MDPSRSTSAEQNAGLAQVRQELFQRLDDLRGFGILAAGSEPHALAGEEALMDLALSLVDALESTQRRVIETSIQILSLRELVTKLLSLRTPAEVAETVTLYLNKAFDHERVLVGVFHPDSNRVEGWAAVRNGKAKIHSFVLDGDWGGSLRQTLESRKAVRAIDGGEHTPFLTGNSLPPELSGFGSGTLGPYLAYPLQGRGQKDDRVVGVLMVGRSAGTDFDDMEAGILEPVVEAVGTAMESVILEEEARREEAFRKDIMGSMASGLIAVDLEGRVLTQNASTQELTGFSVDDLRGKKTGSLDAAAGGISALLAKTLKARRPILRVERVIQRADGSAFPAACSTSLLRNPRGDVYGAVVTFNDLTEIKEMEERIRSLDRLAALGRFTAGIAHEIRNPLTGISTGVQYLERHIRGDEEHAENLEFIQNEIRRLDRIVADLFRVTHPHPLQKADEDPRKMVERAIQSLGDLPARRGIEIAIEAAKELPRVSVDPDQIQQVLLNLLKNAVEASPEKGKVEIRIQASPEDTRPRMVIQVLDRGPGIDPDSLPQIFEPFFTSGKPNGTGLGLYVSHGIVERHGGELHATNNNDGGAIFTLRLPLESYQMTEML